MPATSHPIALCRLLLAASLPALLTLAAHAQGTADGSASLYARPPLAWIQAAAVHEIPIITQVSPYIRYHELYQGNKGAELRDVIESTDGSVARLLARNGQPLTADQDAAERARLQHLLDKPSDYYRHHDDDASDKKRAVTLVNQLSRAMIYTYAPDQTPAPGHPTPQVVIDYRPDPTYHPPDTASQALQGASGRIWLDAASGRMVRMHADVNRDINFGWGLLARIYKGGSLDFEQVDTGPRWIFTRLDEHFDFRALLIKTVRVNTHIVSTNYSQIQPMRFQDAIHILLAEPIPAQCPCY
jgi:hypothetical protein